MIALTLLICAILLALNIYLSPRKHLVHAARAKDFPLGARPSSFEAKTSWLTGGGLLQDVFKSKRFVGKALGPSMEKYGIRDGAEFFGDYLNPKLSAAKRRSLIKPGSVVVVDDVARYSSTGKRLRVVEKLDDEDFVFFCPDNGDNPHTPRPIQKVIAVVTHAAK